MRKKLRVVRAVTVAAAGSLMLCNLAAGDDLYYQGPTDGIGVWNSSAQTYYSWYDVQTGVQHRDQPLNGDSAYLQQASGHGVSNTTVNFNNLYVNPGLAKLTISSGNTLLQSSAGTAMYAQTAELGLGSVSGTYTMTGGTATFNTLRLGAEANSQGNFNLSVGTLTAGIEQIGFFGLGALEEHSGQNNCPEIFVGDDAGGHYRLDGGSMTSHEETVGYVASGIFEQVGGANTTDRLLIGSSSSTANGWFTCAGGTLTVTSALVVGSLGSFSAGGAALIGGPTASPATITVSPVGQFLISDATTLSNSFVLTVGSTIQLQAGSPSRSASLALANASLNLQGGSITGVGAVTLDSLSTVRGAGEIIVPANIVTNNGSVIADSGTLLVNASSLNNSGTLRAYSGSSLIVQLSNPIANQSIVQADAGGAVSFNMPLTNGSGASLSLLGGTIAAPTITNGPGGTLSGLGAINGNLTNNGVATFIGPSQVIGSLTNNTTLTVRNSQLLVTGAGANNGTITAVSGGTAVFNGGLTGNPVDASFSGAATLQAGGGLVANFVRQNSLILQGSAGDPSSYSRVTLRRRADGGDSSTLSSLSIQTDASGTPLGRIDLADNSLTINYGGASPDAQIRSDLVAGYAHGTWGGSGIASSVAAADPGHLGIAYADGMDGVVAGLPAGQELIRMTRVGDVNLDGVVGFSDLLSLAQHYGQSAAKWDRGDLNYDGSVNFTDLLLLAQNYGGTVSTAAIPAGAGSIAAVPEPVTSVILVAPLLARRRRFAAHFA